MKRKPQQIPVRAQFDVVRHSKLQQRWKTLATKMQYGTSASFGPDYLGLVQVSDTMFRYKMLRI